MGIFASENRTVYSPQAGGPINLNFLGHYDYWARWKALVTENSKMSSSGSFSLVPQPELPESTKKGQK